MTIDTLPGDGEIATGAVALDLDAAIDARPPLGQSRCVAEDADAGAGWRNFGIAAEAVDQCLSLGM